MCSNEIEHETRQPEPIRRYCPMRHIFGFATSYSAMINSVIGIQHQPHYTYVGEFGITLLITYSEKEW